MPNAIAVGPFEALAEEYRKKAIKKQIKSQIKSTLKKRQKKRLYKVAKDESTDKDEFSKSSSIDEFKKSRSRAIKVTRKNGQVFITNMGR